MEMDINVVSLWAQKVPPATSRQRPYSLGTEGGRLAWIRRWLVEFAFCSMTLRVLVLTWRQRGEVIQVFS